MSKDWFKNMIDEYHLQRPLMATGNEEEWGAGEGTDEQLPPLPPMSK